LSLWLYLFPIFSFNSNPSEVFWFQTLPVHGSYYYDFSNSQGYDARKNNWLFPAASEIKKLVDAD